jgi:hypothetical protein
MEENATATARGLPDELASTDQGMGARAVTAVGKSDSPIVNRRQINHSRVFIG